MRIANLGHFSRLGLTPGQDFEPSGSEPTSRDAYIPTELGPEPITDPVRITRDMVYVDRRSSGTTTTTSGGRDRLGPGSGTTQQSNLVQASSKEGPGGTGEPMSTGHKVALVAGGIAVLAVIVAAFASSP